MIHRRHAVALAAVLLVLPAAATGYTVDPQDTGATGTATTAALEAASEAGAGARIDAIVHPLATVPTVTDDPTRLTVELDADEVSPSVTSNLQDVEATLTPSFGAADTTFTYDAVSAQETTSSVWPDRTVVRVTFEARNPSTVPIEINPVLHDLTVDYPGGSDTQPRAVEYTESFSENPRFVVLADPQVGDARSLRDGGEDSMASGSPYPFLTSAERTFGDGTEDGRWASFQKAIQEINLLDPDLVLVAGDLAMGDEYNVEYEDAYRLVNTIQAPTYMAMGNHDGYVPWGEDGYSYWRSYFGPLNYSVDYGDDVHILSINTYDWDEMDRAGFGPATSAFGGQVQDDQLRWIRDDLSTWRADNPQGLVLTVGHHNPTWEQSRYREASPGGFPAGEAANRTDGIPVAEQVARGAVSFGTTGQAWAGENRLPLRDVLRDMDPAGPGHLLFFSGHTHRDRVARTVHGGNVVGTTGPGGLPSDESAEHLHYRERNDTFRHDFTQDELRSLLEDWSRGPLFVDTTTTSSSTNQYFGWRLVNLTEHPGLEPGYQMEHMGYDANRSLVENHTRNPSFWNEDHADLGLFSTPSYFLDISIQGPNDGTSDSVEVSIDSKLDEAYSLVVPIALQGADYDLVRGESVVWHRTDGGTQDLGVAVTIPADGEATAHAATAP